MIYESASIFQTMSAYKDFENDSVSMYVNLSKDQNKFKENISKLLFICSTSKIYLHQIT